MNRAQSLFSSKDQSPLTCMSVDPKGEIIAFGAENGLISIYKYKIYFENCKCTENNTVFCYLLVPQVLKFAQ